MSTEETHVSAADGDCRLTVEFERTRRVSVSGVLNFATSRNGVVLRSDNTLGLQQASRLRLMERPSGVQLQVQIKLSPLIIGQTYIATGKPTLNTVNSSAKVDAVMICDRDCFIEIIR